MRYSAVILALMFLTSPSVFSKTLPEADLKVGPIHGEVVEDVGCVLRARGSQWNAPPIFLDTIAGPPMANIGGKDVTLKRVEDMKDENNPEYEAGDLHVQVVYGRGHTDEGGGTYKHVKIVVTRSGRKATTRAEGYCGC